MPTLKALQNRNFGREKIHMVHISQITGFLEGKDGEDANWKPFFRAWLAFRLIQSFMHEFPTYLAMSWKTGYMFQVSKSAVLHSSPASLQLSSLHTQSCLASAARCSVHALNSEGMTKRSGFNEARCGMITRSGPRKPKPVQAPPARLERRTGIEREDGMKTKRDSGLIPDAAALDKTEFVALFVDKRGFIERTLREASCSFDRTLNQAARDVNVLQSETGQGGQQTGRRRKG